MAKKPRPYSMAYTAAGTPRRYLLSGIPAGLWIKVRAQAKREHIAVRPLILGLLEGWLASRDDATRFDRLQRAARRSFSQEEKARLAASAGSATLSARQTPAAARGSAPARRRP